MTLLVDALNGLGVVLLPVAAGLLFEEMTFGGLVRLLFAPWPGTGKTTKHNRKEEGKCSH
ncbi:MAG: hypothetical protein WAM85_19890 [Terracidiphilus sp.]